MTSVKIIGGNEFNEGGAVRLQLQLASFQSYLILP